MSVGLLAPSYSGFFVYIAVDAQACRLIGSQPKDQLRIVKVYASHQHAFSHELIPLTQGLVATAIAPHSLENTCPSLMHMQSCNFVLKSHCSGNLGRGKYICSSSERTRLLKLWDHRLELRTE